MRRKEEISTAVSRLEAIRSRSSLGSSRRDMGGDGRCEGEARLEVEGVAAQLLYCLSETRLLRS